MAGGINIGRAAGAIRQIESGSFAGNYQALGPISPRNGDRAYGAYQVMGANVGPWTEKYYGERLTPSQFLNNPAAQDSVFQGEFGGYVNRFGSGGAAAQAWLGGPGSVGNLSRTDFTGTSIGTYANRFNANYDNPRNVGQFSNGQVASSDGTTAAAGGTVTTDAGDGTIVRQTMNPDGTVAEVELGGSAPSDATNPTGGGTGNAANQGSGQSSPNGAQGGSGQSQNPGSGSGGSGFGAYMNEVARAIANQLSPSTEKAGQTVATATEKSGQTIAKGSTDAAQIAAAQSKATNTLFSDLSKDYFGRAIVVILGIVFVAGGVAMFVYNRNPVALAKQALT